MGELETTRGRSGAIGVTPAHREPTLLWIRPDKETYVPPPSWRVQPRRRSESTTAMIVVVLTFACTLLAIFDLIQLAAGI
jgi:hypothetical protein